MYADYANTHFVDEEANFQHRLARANRFTDADIEANRKGAITGKQKVRLAFAALVPFFGMFFTLLGLVVLAVGLYILGPKIALKVRWLLVIGKYLTLGAAGLFFGAVALIIKFCLASGRVFHLILDLMEGKATFVNGRLTTSMSADVEDGLSTVTNHKTETFSYVVKGEYFQVDQDAVDLMRERDGGNYRLFVTPRSRYLLSLESAVSEPGVFDGPEKKDPFKLEYKPNY